MTSCISHAAYNLHDTAGTLASHIYKAEKLSLCIFHLKSNDYLTHRRMYQSDSFAKPTAHPLAQQSLLKQVSHHCHLPSITRPVSGY